VAFGFGREEISDGLGPCADKGEEERWEQGRRVASAQEEVEA
jgi:hypothetical protein